MTLVLRHLRHSGDLTSPMRFGRFPKWDAEDVVRLDIIVTGNNLFETESEAIAEVEKYAALADPKWIVESAPNWRLDLDALRTLTDCEVEVPWPAWVAGQASGRAAYIPHSRWRIDENMRPEIAEQGARRSRTDRYFGPALVVRIFVGRPPPSNQPSANSSVELVTTKARLRQAEADLAAVRAKNAGRLALDSRLGGGAHADVWRALDCFGRLVAAKIVRPSVAGYVDARSHAVTLSRLEHPNIVRVYTIETVTDPDSKQEVEAIVMEHLDGTTLEKHLRGPRLSADLCRSLGAQLVEGVRHMHKNGLAHGDLHPGNLIINNDRLKIIDPLYKADFAILSTTSRETRLQRDLSDTRRALLLLLRHSDLSQAWIDEFTDGARDGSSLEELSAHFVDVLDT